MKAGIQKKALGQQNGGFLRYYVITFLLSALPKVILALQAVPLRTNSDELATMASAAYLAGYDWSEVVSNAGYYGFGYYSLFFWVFKLTDNPLFIYRTILVCTCLIQSLAGIIALHLMLDYLKVKDFWLACFFSAACTYMSGARIVYAYNEHIIVFFSWVVAWLLLVLMRLQNQPKRKILVTCLLILVLSYGLTIHTRLLVFWIALFCLVMLYRILYHKWLVSFVGFLPVAVFGYLGSEYISKQIQDVLWRADGGTLRNTSISVSNELDFFSPVTWKAMLSIILGQMNTVSFFTAGLCILCTVAIVKVAFVEARRVFVLKDTTVVESRIATVVLGWMFLLCIAGTIFGQSLTWLPQTIQGVTGGFPSKEYGVKSFTYMRYFAPYVGPLLIAGVAFLSKNGQRMRNALNLTAIITAVLLLFWVAENLPYLANNGQTYEPLTALGLGKYDTSHGDNFLLQNYIIAIIIASVVFWIFFVLLKKGRMVVFGALFCVFLAWQYMYTAVFFDFQAQAERKEVYSAGYQFIHSVEDEIELPNTIYVVDTLGLADHQNFYLYQFWLNRYTIVPEVPPETESQAIVLTNSGSDLELLAQGYEVAQLDDNEFLYVKDPGYIETFEGKGLNFQAISEINLIDNMTIRSNVRNGYCAFGPYATFQAGTYTVEFTVQYDAALAGDGMGYCDVSTMNGQKILGQNNIYSQVSGQNLQTIQVNFTTTTEESGVEFRIYNASTTEIQLLEIKLQKAS